MNRILQFVNLAGVLALGVLALAQWRVNRHLNLELTRLEVIRLDQSQKLDARDRTVQAYAADLEQLREHLTRITGEQRTAETQWKASQTHILQLEAERDRLKENIRQWVTALTARDEQIKLANQQIKELIANCNETVRKYNELATNFNAVVQDLNERTRQFNELMAKYHEGSKR